VSAPDFVNRANAEFIDQLYEQYRSDPESLEPTWRAFFAGLELGREDIEQGDDGGAAAGRPSGRSTFGLVNAYRELGHLLAKIDPLSDPPLSHPLLALEHFDFSEADLDLPCDPDGFRGEPPPKTLRELVGALRDTYCRTLGVEYTGIRDPEQRAWLESRMEPLRNEPELDHATRLLVYSKLTEAEAFEQFLNVKYPGAKRFSLEGGETFIPMLETLIEGCAEASVEHLVLGMAHRGRLNVLANIVRKPYEMILSEFEGSSLPDWVQGDGDVKYHQGYSRDHHSSDGKTVHVSLTPNPSHLEVVNPVVEGKVRAKQTLIGDRDHARVLPVLVHGDASFVGQGVVPETLLLCHLPGYYTGGTVHIVINNQVGFTTPPNSGRPTRYATDIARIIESPVFHVNGDDPEAAVHAVRLALGFRQTFGKDVVIALVCFRKYGHNELDEPTFTQPTMYKKIAQHPGTRALYERELLEQHGFSKEELDGVRKEILEILDLALSYARDFRPRQEVFSFGDAWSGLGPAPDERSADTAVPRARLELIAERALQLPEGFHPHPKVLKQYEARLEMLRRGKGIDWGCAEMLAYGTLVLDGTPVRLSGQDSGRGTFSHRHSVLHDQENGQQYVPLNTLARAGETQAPYEVIDSMLSEVAVLGFEYGYSIGAPHTLTIWEAQFGDFANGAQAVIDTFIAAAESKWQRSSGLVLLLPHGYEGQGPEHSSARLERFLQMCADDNLQVANASTAAQIFHLLRRQILRPFRKPLIVMSPKSLLRLGAASSSIEDLSEGIFHPVLPDPVSVDPETVTTIALCSGKVFYDFGKEREARADLRVVAARVEELYPFPDQEISAIFESYPNARDIVWMQEEPVNMGAWWYMSQRIPAILDGRTLRYAGRDEAASPATGSYRRHGKEQAALLAAVFDQAPERAVAARPRRIAKAGIAQAGARSN